MKRSPRVTSASSLTSVICAVSPSVAHRVRFENEITAQHGTPATPDVDASSEYGDRRGG
jgi:hypothetical protein